MGTGSVLGKATWGVKQKVTSVCSDSPWYTRPHTSYFENWSIATVKGWGGDWTPVRENDPLHLKYIRYPNSCKQAALRDAVPCKEGYHSLLSALSEFRAQQQIGDDAFSRTVSLPSAGLLLLAPSSRTSVLQMRWVPDLWCKQLLSTPCCRRDERWGRCLSRIDRQRVPALLSLEPRYHSSFYFLLHLKHMGCQKLKYIIGSGLSSWLTALILQTDFIFMRL